jgi:HEPN domain-containing protein
MGLPRIAEARLFYQFAIQRYEDAEFLLDAERTTGAIYLAGYGVEGMLKALILSILPPARQRNMLNSFRGARAHDYDWLKARYLTSGGASFPSTIAKGFSLVETWTTELRYLTKAAKRRDAEAFLKAVKEIMDWADGRF